MNEKNSTEPIPENFTRLEEAADFWEAHDLDDYWEQLREVEVEVSAPRRRWIPLAPDLAQQVAERARREGLSVETLINLWVAERLQA